MRVTAIYGSPRLNGNSAALANHMTSLLEKHGATVKKFYLNKMKYKGCQGCLKCKTGAEKCVLKDDLSEVLDAIPDTDLLLISSAVYFGDVTAQTKGFIDRIYSFYLPEFWLKEYKSRLRPGKKLAFILSQGNGDERFFADIEPKYSAFLKSLGVQRSFLVRACGVSMPGDAEKRQDLLDQVEKTVDEIIK